MPTVQALSLFRAALVADGSYDAALIHDLTLIALEGEIARDGLNVAPAVDTDTTAQQG